VSVGFLDPALLWGLLAASLPLLIHLFFRRRPRPLAFPAFEFVLRARRQTERRLKLRRLLLFLARTLVLAAIALALARPRAERPAAAAATSAGPAATVIVLDGSGSMAYRLGGESLFERGRRQALAALTALGNEEPVAALPCDGGAPTAVAPSFDRAAARQALAEAQPGALRADLNGCLAAALQGLAEGRGPAGLGRRIVVVTDLTASAWRLDVPPPQGAEVRVVDAAGGASLPNLAVTELTAEPDAAVGPRGYRVTATVLNAGAERAGEVSLTLRAAGDPRPPVRAFLDLPPGGTVRKTFSHAFAAGGPAVLTAALPPDALPLDDQRALTLRVPREVKALVVDGAPSPIKLRDEAWFVEAALASAASPVRPTLIDAEALAGADLKAFDVVLLLNVRSVGTRGADLEAFVHAGGGLFISMGDQVDPDAANRELAALLPLPLHLVKTAAPDGARGPAGGGAPGGGAARLARLDEAHPALAVFTGEAREGLTGARFQRYMLTRPAGRGEPPRVLAAFEDGAPALVEARRGQGRVLLYTSTVDRDWTDWPLRTSFLPVMQRLAGWLSGALEDRRDPPTVVGSPRTLHLGPGRRLAGLVGPDGAAVAARDLGAAVVATPDGGGDVTLTPRRPGTWQVRVEEHGATRLEGGLAFAAVLDPRESDTRRLEPAALAAWLGGAAVAKLDGAPGGGATGPDLPLWSILLAVAVALFLLEAALLS
jgi:hypothetical protein